MLTLTPERWQQIRDLLHSAMQLDPAQRPAYLEHHCSGDPSLRKDVDSLLAAEHELRGSFLESPAIAQVVPDQDATSVLVWTAGIKLGPHRIICPLGAGGMSILSASSRRHPDGIEMNDWTQTDRRIGMWSAISAMTIGLIFVVVGLIGVVARSPSLEALHQVDPYLAILSPSSFASPR